MSVREILQEVADTAMSYQTAVIDANSYQRAADQREANKAEAKLEEVLEQAEKKLQLKES